MSDPVDKFMSHVGKNHTHQEKEKIIDEFMREAIPSFYKLKRLEEDYKKTPAYAWEQLEGIEKHFKKEHGGSVDKCYESGCSYKEKFNREETEKHLHTIMAEIIKYQDEIGEK